MAGVVSTPGFFDADVPRSMEETMFGVTAFVGVCAALLIVAGIFFVLPVSVAVAAVLEVSGVILAVAFLGLTDGM